MNPKATMLDVCLMALFFYLGVTIATVGCSYDEDQGSRNNPAARASGEPFVEFQHPEHRTSPLTQDEQPLPDFHEVPYQTPAGNCAGYWDWVDSYWDGCCVIDVSSCVTNPDMGIARCCGTAIACCVGVNGGCGGVEPPEGC